MMNALESVGDDDDERRFLIERYLGALRRHRERLDALLSHPIDTEPEQGAVWGSGLDYGVAPNATDDEEDSESTHSSVSWYNEDVGDVESFGANSNYERDGTWNPERDS
jgi:hypothetical protein